MELAYAGLEVADKPAMDKVFSDILGLAAAEDEPAVGSAWTNDARAQRILVTEGPANDLAFLGFEYGPEEYPVALERMSRAGQAITEGGPADLAVRKVEQLFRVTAPWGTPVELVRGLAESREEFASPLMRSGFLTKGVGFGHAVIQVSDEALFEASHTFIIEALGFEQSDWFEADPEVGVVARFYHCNARHHTLALGFNPNGVPRTLNHLMFEVNDIDDVGAACDRALEVGATLDRGLGRHDNDRMFSFYVECPAGFRFECGAGAREIVQPWTENRRYDRGSVWGHHGHF
jgi:2,3-dihydroxybiphenyl 1,2-dioxygenase